ncbi:MAG: UMP kinase [Sedimentisphaerales bacterium]|nr:UMP kinase [Sedimentisphaerales bacterium]
MVDLEYHRVLLKVSGEGLSGTGGFGLDGSELDKLTDQIAEIVNEGAQVGLVVGAGNFVRGQALSAKVAVERVTGDQMGMLATVINSLALRDVLISKGTPAQVLSSMPIGNVCEQFSRQRAIGYLEQGQVVIFCGGTGNPFFTTDTASTLRAAEIDADVIVKATKVDGVFSDDPVKNPDAKLYSKLSFDEVLAQDLKVMDHAAISMCRDNDIDIIVCNLMKPPAVLNALRGEAVGTRVSRAEKL